MNEHIELVKKWLANKDSVSQEELEVNAAAAYDAADAYDDAAYDDAACAAACAHYAAYDAYGADDSAAAHWVRRYEELTK